MIPPLPTFPAALFGEQKLASDPISSLSPFSCRGSHPKAGAKLEEQEKALSGYSSAAHFFHICMETFKTHAHGKNENKDGECKNRVATNEDGVYTFLSDVVVPPYGMPIAGSRERGESKKHAQFERIQRTYTHTRIHRHTQTLIPF